MNKSTVRWAGVAALGILAIAGIEAYAISQGINGTGLTVSIAGITGLGGASVGRLLK